MYYVFAILIGYLLGCSSMAFYIGKIKKVDFRKAGSTNLGASNVTVVAGWRAGILVGAHDIAKGVLAVLVADLLFPATPYIGYVAGVASIMGHIFPFYLGFRGGKGFATYLGMTLMLDWKFFIVLVVIVIAVILLSKYTAIATMVTIVIVPVYMGIRDQNIIPALILLIATAVMFLKHIENIKRLIEIVEEDGTLKFRTRGDNNNTEDKALVPAENLVGIYRSRIGGAGNVAMFLQSTPGLIVCIVLPLGLLIGYDVLRRRKYDKAKQQDTDALLAELEALRAMKAEQTEPQPTAEQPAEQPVEQPTEQA